MTPQRRRFAAALLPLFGAACTAIAGLPDVPNPEGGTPTESGTDGTPSDTTVRPPDAAADASDASATGDVDGSSDADAAPPACDPDATMADPDNCGVCGHSCLGGECLGGICQPFTIAYGAQGPHGITLDDNNVYFTAYGSASVSAVSKDGGPVTTIATNQVSPSIPVVQGSTLFWTAGAGVQSTTLPAEDAGPIEDWITGLNYPFGMTLSPTTLYVVANGSNFIASLLLADGPQPDGSTQVEILVDAGGIVMVNTNATAGYFTASGMVGTFPIAGGPAYALATTYPDGGPLSSPWGLAIDGANVYFGDQTGGMIGEIPLDGGPVTLIATAQDAPRCVTVDSQFVYWAEWGGGHVRRAPIGGGAITDLASNQAGPLCLAVDATAIYWTNFYSNNVVKLAK